MQPGELCTAAAMQTLQKRNDKCCVKWIFWNTQKEYKQPRRSRKKARGCQVLKANTIKHNL